MNMAKPEQLLTEFYATDADGRRINRQTLLYNGLMYLHFGVALMGYLPLWTMLLSMPILAVRWMVSLHELYHLKEETKVDFITRLMPPMFTPLSLGYREFQDIHWCHHRFMATPEDPDYYQIRGSKLIGFINALTLPDQAYFRWVACKGIDLPLLGNSLIRLTVFVAMVWLSGLDFFWYWVPLRFAYGCSGFAFFYCLHRRGELYGVYPLRFSPLGERLITLLFGREALSAACHHDIHHADPRVVAVLLPEVTQLLG